MGRYSAVNYYEFSQDQKAHNEFWGYHFRAGFSFKQEKGSNIVPNLVFTYGNSITGNGGYLAGISLLAGLPMGK